MPIVPAGSRRTNLFHTAQVHALGEVSSSKHNKSKSPNTYNTSPSPGHLHRRGPLHEQFCCTKMLEAKTYN